MDLSVLLILLALAVPLFFFWRWVYRKQASVLRKRVLTWLTTILTTPVLYALVILAWVFCAEYYPNREFDPKAWQADSDKRYEYSHDLIKSRLLIGKNRNQVEQLLGRNNDTSQTELYYYIGYRPEPMGIDPSSLIINFKDGKVDTVIEHDR